MTIKNINLSIITIFTGYFLFLAGLNQAMAGPPPLPVTIPDNQWQPLHKRVEPTLQARLETVVNRNSSWRQLIFRKKMAVGVVDLSDIRAPRYARVNGRSMMYAASLPKIAILLAAFVSFEDGSLEETPEIHEDLVAMIRTSSNSAATRMIDRIGFEKIQAVLMDPRYRFYDREKGGGLWVGKRYAKQGVRNPEPIKGLSHAATVIQTCRFYYLLATGKIINPDRSRQMLAILSNPGLHHKFINPLQNRVPLSRLFRKSGTWKTYHADSVLVWGETWRWYILTAMVDSDNGEQIIRDIVPVVEDILRPGRVP